MSMGEKRKYSSRALTHITSNIRMKSNDLNVDHGRDILFKCTGLGFSETDWDSHTLEFTQKKTKQNIK